MDFHYNDTDVSIEGNSQVLLSTLIAQLNITDAEGALIDVNDVASVSFTDERLVTVEEVSGETEVNGEKVTIEGKDFLLTSNEPFTSAEQLVLTLVDKAEIAVDVTDDQETTNTWNLADSATIESLSVHVDESVTQTELERDAIFKITFVYTLKEEVVKAIDEYHGNSVLEYDLASFAEQFPGGITDSSNGVMSVGNRKIGNYAIRNGKVILTFTDPGYFDGMSTFTGYFDITVQTKESLVSDDGEYNFSFPGTTDTIPIQYKKSVEEGSKQVTKEQNSDGSYTLHYTANINVNSDLTSMTFFDTLGGLQKLDPSSVKIDGRPVTNVQTSGSQNFSFDVAAALGTTGVAKGSYQVTYDTKVTEEQLKAMESDKTTETNKVTWKVNGTKDVPGGETSIELEKPKEPIPVVKQSSAADASMPGDPITYTITYGNENTELSGFQISDSMTDVVIPQGQVQITYNGQTENINFSSNIADTNYSKNMVPLFDYTFPEGTAGNGPVKVTYSVKLIDGETAKQNGVYGETNVDNIAQEHRQNTQDNKTTKVTYEKEPHYDVEKTAEGTYAPGSVISYTLTIGDENTNMAGVNIRDVMTDLQVLEGDIMIKIGNGTLMKLSDYVAGAITYTDDGRYSTADVELFNFNMPSDAGYGPVVITYTTKVIDADTAHSQNIYDDRNIKNTGYGGKQSDETQDHVDFGDYPIGKTVTQNGVDVNGQTLAMDDIVHYTLTLGNPEMDMSNAVIEDWMTDLQKLVGNITITKPGGDTFNMPIASGPYAEDGCRWPFLNDDQYSTAEICLFRYKLPAGFGPGPITIEYDCQIIDEAEANENAITDTRDVYNRFIHNGHIAQTDVKINFPKDPAKTPDIRKEFCEYDLENSIVYWNIIVEKTADSAYPLENVVVKEDLYNIHITEHSQGYYNDGSFNASNFDSLRAVVTTDDGTVLTPGVDYIVDKDTVQFTFPVLNERATIKLAFLSPAKIVDGYKVTNHAQLVSPYKDVSADWQYNNPQIDLMKRGTYTEDPRILKWEVIINPTKKAYDDSDPVTVLFKDTIPEGLTLLNYSTKQEGNPSIFVQCQEPYWLDDEIPVSVVDNSIQQLDIAKHEINGNPDLSQGLNKTLFRVTYYTKISNEEWDRITSSASGSETFENHVEIIAGDDHQYEATDKVTVTSDGYLTKTDSTKHDGNGILVVDDSGSPSKLITYTVEINPHGYNLNNDNPLKLTDSIATNMDLDPESVKVVYGIMGSDGKLIAEESTPEGLEISYNDDARLLTINKIPDRTPLVLTYGCYARAQGEDTFTNTATLIGGGSHSASDTEKHTIQTNDAGAHIDGIQFNMLKIDENNIAQKLEGAKFQLYECKLAIGDLSVSHANNQAWWDDLLAMMNRINAGNGSAEDIQWVKDNFVITSYEEVGTPAVTSETGFTQFRNLREHKLYAWKEVQSPESYTGYEEYHYFVGYQHIDVNHDMPQPLLSEEEQLKRKHAAWALDDACQLANGIRVASMANLVTWTATNVESQYTSISATKVWEGDSDNLFETRPTGGIKLQLWQIKEDGTKAAYGDPVAMNVDDNGNWPSHIWNRLPSNYDGNKTYKYTVVEEKVDGYTTSYSDNGAGKTSGEITVTNKMIPKNTSIYVKKVFDQNEADPKPTSIKVLLMVIMTNKQTGEQLPPEEIYTAELRDLNNWSCSWTKLDTTKVIDENGVKTAYDLTYTVVEDTAKLVRDGFGDYIVTYSDNNEGVVGTTQDDPLVITNAKPSNGGLKIKKSVTENGSGDLSDAAKAVLAGTYTFTIYTDETCTTPYQVNGEDVTVTVTIGSNGEAVTSGEVTDMPAGDYWIKETEPTNKAIQPVNNPVKVTVVAGKTGDEAVIAEFINDYKTTKARVQKVWSGGTPQNSLMVDLYAHSGSGDSTTATIVRSVTLTAANNWTSDVIENLPVYDENGNEIFYHWVEGDLPSGYFLTSVTSSSGEDGVVTTTLTNTWQQYNLETSYVGKKTWEDNGNVWNTRPTTDQFKVELYQINKTNGSYPETGTKIEGKTPAWTVNGNEWIYTFEHLPVFDANGDVIMYYAVETVPGGYTNTKITKTQTTWSMGSITYKSGTGRTTPDNQLVWTLGSLIDLSFVAIKPTANGSVCVWTHRVPVPSEKQAILYQLATNALPGCGGRPVAWYSGTGDLITPHGPIHVTYDEENLKVTLKFDSPDEWSQFIWGQFNENGSSSYNIGKTDFTNQLVTTSLEGTKTWRINGTAPVSAQNVTLKLTRKSSKAGATEETLYIVTVDGKTQITTSGTDLLQPTWTDNIFKYANLPAKDSEGNPYTYSVTEASFKVGETTYTVHADGTVTSDPATAPQMEMTQSGNDIINTELTDITVTKAWTGGTWPTNVASVQATISATGTTTDIGTLIAESTDAKTAEITLTSGAPSKTWNNLPAVDDAGNKITYSVAETSVTMTDGTVYSENTAVKMSDVFETDSATNTDTRTTTITNTPKTKDIPVEKKWVFANGTAAWPAGVTVEVKLMKKVGDAEPEQAATVTLSSNTPNHTFTGLPIYDGMNEILYSVEEGEVTGLDISKYDVSVTGNTENGFTITNTEKQADLTITKIVSGKELTDEEKAKITFTITGPEGFTAITKTLSEFTENPAGTFTLTLDQSNGIEAGKTYTVTETGADIAKYIRTTTIAVNNGEAQNLETADVVVDSATAKGTVAITNTYEDNTTSAEATKKWASGETEISWPEDVASVEFTLYKKVGEAEKTAVTTNDLTDYWTVEGLAGFSNPAEITKDKTTAKWENLPKKYLVNGEWVTAIYTVEETKVTYTDTDNTTIQGNDLTTAFNPTTTGTTITNHVGPTTYKVKKTWGEGQQPPEGAEIKIKLGTIPSPDSTDAPTPLDPPKVVTLNGGEEGGNDTQTAWEYEWTDLPKYNSEGKLIYYRAMETSYMIGGVEYINDLTPDMDTSTPNTLVFTNYIPTKNIVVEKEWSPAGWPADIASVTIGLYAKSGDETTPHAYPDSTNPRTVEITKENSSDPTKVDDRTFSDLPVYDSNGNLITYSVEETEITPVSGASVSISDFNVTTKSESTTTGETITLTNTQATGSVQVTKSFVFPAESGLTVPQDFKVTASWTIPAAVEGDTETAFTVNLVTTQETNYTVPEGAAGLPSGVKIERTGDGTTTPYQWTISGLPIGTVVTFTESGYEIAGYIVTTTLNPTNGQATTAVTPDTVAFTNEYVAGVTLPSTGGPGTVLYTAAGLSLILGASLWLMLRRRKEQQN